MNTEKKNPRDAVIVAAGRSAMAKAFKGSFAETHPIEYGAQVLKGVLTKLDHFDPALIDDVIVGCAFPEKRMGYNAAKLIVQRAGLPDSVCAQTINRFCSSGLQSIATAANAIKAGDMDIIVAGGCEQMTGYSKQQIDFLALLVHLCDGIRRDIQRITGKHADRECFALIYDRILPEVQCHQFLVHAYPPVLFFHFSNYIM